MPLLEGHIAAALQSRAKLVQQLRGPNSLAMALLLAQKGEVLHRLLLPCGGAVEETAGGVMLRQLDMVTPCKGGARDMPCHDSCLADTTKASCGMADCSAVCWGAHGAKHRLRCFLQRKL